MLFWNRKKNPICFLNVGKMICMISIFVKTAEQKSLPTGIATVKLYILTLIQLETNIMLLPKLLEKLYYQLSVIRLKVRMIDAAPKMEAYQQMAENRLERQSAEQAYQRSIERLAACKAMLPQGTYPPEQQMPELPGYQKPRLFNKRKIRAKNSALKAKYEAELQEYEFRMTLHRQTVTELQKKVDAEMMHLCYIFETRRGWN